MVTWKLAITLFFTCNMSKEIWTQEGLWSVIDQVLDAADNALDIFFQVCALRSKSRVVLFAMLLWSIGSGRNAKVWDDKDESNVQIICRANMLLEDWKKAKKVNGAHASAPAVTSPLGITSLYVQK